MEARTLSLDEIVVDESINQRADRLSIVIVNEYTAAYEDGDIFPPVDVFDTKEGMLLSDGFHRYQAQAELDIEGIECVVHKGTRKDAILFACKANDKHGYRRTNKDKRKAVRTLLAMFPGRSDRWIAEKAGVDNHTVANVKEDVGKIPNRQPGGTADDESEPDEPETVIGKDGKEYQAKKPKQKQPQDSYPAWTIFRDYMMNLAGIQDGLLAKYDRSVKAMIESGDWDTARTVMAINYLDESIKVFQSLRKEFAKHVTG